MAARRTTSTSTVRTRRRIFVDTGGWYAATARSDPRHASASAYYLDALAQGALLITSDYVLDETLTRLRYDFGHKVAMLFWEQMVAAQSQRLLTTIHVDEAIWLEALGIFRRFDDQLFSFTDCTSFVIARQQRVDEVFALDHHFALHGFITQPAQ